jgi:uncharacterized phage protein (TIGR01671 family)
MRTIKFRAWHSVYKNMFSPEEMGKDQLTVMPDGRGFVNVSGTNTALITFPPMIPMQFTGLFDRDGAEIFEGDILSTDGDTIVVQWDDTCAWFGAFSFGGSSYGMIGTRAAAYKVIGNIHQGTKAASEDT